MHIITQSCALFLWMQLLTFVQSQDCTLQEFLNGQLYDSNFDTSDLQPSYPSGKQLRVNCIIGYTGFFTLICTEGTWTYVGSRCQPLQCPVVLVPNNVHVAGNPEQANFGSVLRFRCKNRNDALNGPAEIYCDGNGLWNRPPPTCEEIKCFKPVISNGMATGDITEYKKGGILNYECNKGYQKSDIRSSVCIKLGSRAEWSPTPMCEGVKCMLPPPIGESTYEPPYRNTFLPGESVTITCGERSWVGQRQDTVVSTCLNTGKWDIEPLCTEATCIKYDPHVESWRSYWNYKITLNDTVGYTCRTGYKKPPGVNHATCTTQGWSPNPLCEVSLDCGTPPHVPGGDVKYTVNSTYKHGQRVEYMCQRFYKMEGGPYKTCHDGEWIGDIRCIEPCTVNKELMRTHNIELSYRTDDDLFIAHDDRVTFFCITGTTPDRVLRMTQYCNEGVIHLPTCQLS